MTLGSRSGRVTRLDGAMGTALLARGLPTGHVPETWVLARPWEVAAVHAAHVAAGAEVVLTCTFNLARLDLAGPGLDVTEVARRAVALARSARPLAVAGCAGATGLARPGARGPSPAEFRERYEVAIRALATAGVDLICIETQLDLDEARAALEAGRRAGLPVLVTAFLLPAAGGMAARDGSSGLDFLEALWRDGAAAVGVNCVAPDTRLSRFVAGLASRVPIPLVVKPNAGLPGQPVGPAAFAAGVAAAVRAGATLVGGCCGAGPEHLRAIGAAIGARPAQARG
ncbi:MAG: Homocysteine S-methyltransferase [Anaeromyxobacteraceae bacterium]|nr:Homocysteine S-methyltransferase [Anaeromyxobacteraceae bacterium]